MKPRILATALVLTFVASFPAYSAISKPSLNQAINSAIANGSLTAVVDGSTVTIFGIVEDTYDANHARQAALNVEGVDKVISRLTISH